VVGPATALVVGTPAATVVGMGTSPLVNALTKQRQPSDTEHRVPA
jgi:hypothetical protein